MTHGGSGHTVKSTKGSAYRIYNGLLLPYLLSSKHDIDCGVISLPNSTAMVSTKLAITDTLSLPNSIVEIPSLGFGVYESHGEQCVASVLAALKAGYRHIDTAQYYENEKEVGEAVRHSALKRSDIFITTKIDHSEGSVEETYQCVVNSVKAIGGEDGVVDLFLVHTADIGPADCKIVWLALEKLLEAGKTRSIGVSNYGIGHIEEMKKYAKIWPPHVNQNEVSPPSQL
jgi:diketogulonate reductase-like aldo/keto reductase